MAGLFGRIANRGENDAPIAADTAWSLIYLVGTGVFTGAQARDTLNAKLPPDKQLTAAEILDFNNILTAAALGSASAKLDYANRVRAVFIVVEVGLLTNEATFRAQLSLP